MIDLECSRTDVIWKIWKMYMMDCVPAVNTTSM